MTQKHDSHGQSWTYSSTTKAWFLHHYGCSSPEKAITDLARELLARANVTTPPVQVYDLLKHRKVLRVVSRDIKVPARLTVVDDGFAIILQRYQAETRRRFSVAHELAHTFFYDTDSMPPRKLLNSPLSGGDVERLCNLAAAEILLPEGLLKEAVSSLSSSEEKTSLIEHFGDLLHSFRVSAEALGRRLVEDLCLLRCVLIGTTWRPKPHRADTVHRHPTSCWRMSWFAVPPDLSPALYLPSSRRGPKVRLEIVERAYQQRRPVSAHEPAKSFRLGNLQKVLRNALGARERYDIYAIPLVPEGVQLDFHEGASNEMSREGPESMRRRAQIVVCVVLDEGERCCSTSRSGIH